jgi:hypothetical protein
MKRSLFLFSTFLFIALTAFSYDMRQGFILNQGQWKGGHRKVYFENKDMQQAIRLTNEGMEYEWMQLEGSEMKLQRAVLRPINGDLSRFEAKESMGDVFFYNVQGQISTAGYKSVVFKNVYPNVDWKIYQTENGLKYDWIVFPGGDVRNIQMEWTGLEDLGAQPNGGLCFKSKLGELLEERPVSFQEGEEIATRFVVKDNVVSFKVDEYDSHKVLTIDPEVIWSSYYGGESYDEVNGIAADISGNVYITGTTTSTTNISGNAVGALIHQTNMNGTRDAFLAKFNMNGQRLWATYYGGEGQDEGNSIAIDEFGFVYLAGTTTSTFAVASFGFQTALMGIRDGYMVKFTSNGQRVWGSYLGGSGTENVLGMTVDNDGRLILLGETTSNDFLISGTGDQVYSGQGDVFVTCIAGIGAVYWSVYFGGENLENAGGIGYDAVSDRVFITGTTASVTGISSGTGQQMNFGGGLKDGFLGALDEQGNLVWSTYVGGTGIDEVRNSSSDIYGNIYIVGTTSSAGMATAGAHQTNFGGGASDAFMSQYNVNGGMLWRSYFGGPGTDEGSAMVADKLGNIYFGGQTNSQGLSLNNPFQNTVAGGTDAFFSKFTVEGFPQWTSYYGGTGNEELNFLNIDYSQKLLFAGSAASANLSDNGWQSALNGGQDGWFGKLEDCPNPYITIAYDGDLEFCEGESIMLGAGGADWYVWSTGDTIPFIDVEETSDITLRGVLNGCQGISLPLHIEVKPVPEVEIIASGPTTFCPGDLIAMELYPSISPDSLIAYWEWNDGTQNDVQYVEGESEWTIQVTAINGCDRDASVSIAYVEMEEIVMAVPNEALCISDAPMQMIGYPFGGTFVSSTGMGIDGTYFNPAQAGGGIHVVHYEILDEASGCASMTNPISIEVLYAPTELFIPSDTICVDAEPMLMMGLPIGGFYTGLGVSGSNFYPNLAGPGWHEVSYNYIDPQGCDNRAFQSIYVDPCGFVLQQDDVQIRLFPNPVNDVLNIKAEGIIVAPYHLVNMQGQVVIEGVLQSSELLDVSKLGSGLYRIILYSQQEILTLPFVKE